jgi:hypothetical protein
MRPVSLWVSQVARVLADWCLRVTVLLGWSRAAGSGGDAWCLTTTVLIAPLVHLAPLNGCINNGLPHRWVLAGSAAYTLLVVALFGAPWPYQLRRADPKPGHEGFARDDRLLGRLGRRFLGQYLRRVAP